MDTTIEVTAIEKKRSEVRNAAIRQLVPEFNENLFAASLMQSGVSFTELKEKVNAEKKAHKAKFSTPLTFDEVKQKLSGDVRVNLLSFAEISESKFNSMTEIFHYDIIDGKLEKTTPTTTKEIIDAILSQSVFAEYCRKNAIESTKQETALNDALKIVATNFVSLGLSYSELTAKLSRAIDSAKVEQNKLETAKKADRVRLLNNYWFATSESEKLLHDILFGVVKRDEDGKPNKDGKTKFGKAKRNKLVARLKKLQSSRQTCKKLLATK